MTTHQTTDAIADPGTTTGPIADAVTAGRLPGRVWVYSNYHCNLSCTYCLTESSPDVDRRSVSGDQMRRIAVEAAELGFTALGVTGGEPILAPDIVGTVADMADVLPTVVLSNATLFTDVQIRRLAPWAKRDVSVQVSLDSPDPDVNDAARGEDNFAKVVDAIPRLVDAGIHVRIATTSTSMDPADNERLCALHRGLGVSDDDHIVRPVIRRGRGVEFDGGIDAGQRDLPAELTVTADGAFWSPFGPTVRDGILDTDLLITRTTSPLRTPAEALLGLVNGRPPGEDAVLNIR